MNKWQTAFIVFIALLLCGASTAETRLMTYGKGPLEVILFTDFFCPPCQKLEGLISGTLDNIINNNIASVTFVPLPMSKKSMILALHLISYSEGKSYKAVAQNRKKLYDMAKSGAVTDEMVDQWVQKYRGKSGELNPYIKSMNDTIIENNVTSTPTCIIRYAGGVKQTFKGYKDIQDALNALRKT